MFFPFSTIVDPRTLAVRLRWIVGLLAVGVATTCTNGSGTGQVLADPVSVTFDKPLNLIVLEAKIRGRGPFRFVLDSGAPGTVIEAGLAQRLGLETSSAYTRRGTVVGSQVTAASVRGGVDFAFAPGFQVHIDHVITAPVTKSARIMLGEHVDGILGSAIFFSYVIEVDYVERVLIFHDPAGYRYDGEGATLELEFPEGSLPVITATIINGDRRLEDFPIYVDSGGKTMGTANVATRHDWDRLILPANRVVDAMGATGLSNDVNGTTHEAFFTRMERLVIGPFEFDDPVVSYSAGGPGMAAMGASLLHRFTTVFDYSRKQLILKPNADFDKPIMVDQSGVLLVMSTSGKQDFEVMFVAEGTPAHKAGLARGDVIVAVDGKPAREIRLNDMRALLCRSNAYRLEVKREGRDFETIMTTRPLFDG